MDVKIKYEKWEPLESLPKRLYCEAMHNDYEGIRILLKGEEESSPMLRVKFESILAFRSIDEGCLHRTLDKIRDREIFPFYKVQNSDFLSWFHNESYDSYNDRNIVHYAFFCQDEIIDILSEFEPAVEWLNC